MWLLGLSLESLDASPTASHLTYDKSSNAYRPLELSPAFATELQILTQSDGRTPFNREGARAHHL